MFKSNKGFTLVELIVVIAILAILAGVAVPAYTGYINKANDTAAITELAAVKTAAEAAAALEGVTVDTITVSKTGTIAVTIKETTSGITITEAEVKAFFTSTTLGTSISKHSTFKANGATWTAAGGWVAQ